jgi:hypothetical protein
MKIKKASYPRGFFFRHAEAIFNPDFAVGLDRETKVKRSAA